MINGEGKAICPTPDWWRVASTPNANLKKEMTDTL
jgi:hypothetical protein